MTAADIRRQVVVEELDLAPSGVTAVVVRRVIRGIRYHGHLLAIPLDDGRAVAKPRVLTSGGVRDTRPRVSPDGRHVAFVRSWPGDDDKLARAVEWGADVGVNHAKGDVVGAVRETTGKGVDVVVESVGEATWARSLAAVRPTGRVVVCGATSGPNPPAQLHRFWWKQLTVLGSSMGTREDFLGAYDLVRTGRVGVHVDRVYPLSEIRAAHERLEAGEQLGKIVLVMPDEGS